MKRVYAIMILALGSYAAITPNAFAGDAAHGQSVFNTTCVACHGEDGKGAFSGIPDFTEKNGRLAKTDQQLFESVKFGMQTPGSMMAMPALGGNPEITDKEVEDVIAFLKLQFAPK